MSGKDGDKSLNLLNYLSQKYTYAYIVKWCWAYQCMSSSTESEDHHQYHRKRMEKELDYRYCGIDVLDSILIDDGDPYLVSLSELAKRVQLPFSQKIDLLYFTQIT